MNRLPVETMSVAELKAAGKELERKLENVEEMGHQEAQMAAEDLRDIDEELENRRNPG